MIATSPSFISLQQAKLIPCCHCHTPAIRQVLAYVRKVGCTLTSLYSVYCVLFFSITCTWVGISLTCASHRFEMQMVRRMLPWGSCCIPCLSWKETKWLKRYTLAIQFYTSQLDTVQYYSYESQRCVLGLIIQWLCIYLYMFPMNGCTLASCLLKCIWIFIIELITLAEISLTISLLGWLSLEPCS